MTDAERRGPGVRPVGPASARALPPRDDPSSKIWAIVVAAIVALVFVLALLGVPSRFIPEPTPVPLPSFPVPSPPGETDGAGEPSPEESPDVTDESPDLTEEPAPGAS